MENLESKLPVYSLASELGVLSRETQKRGFNNYSSWCVQTSRKEEYDVLKGEEPRTCHNCQGSP